MTKADRINACLLDIDDWFGAHGGLIPAEPRGELENHLRRLSVEMYHGDSIVSHPAYKAEQEALNERSQALLDAITPAGFIAARPTIYFPDPVPVFPFDYDAELAKRAMDRRDALTADKVAMVVIWIVLAIGMACFLFSDWGWRAMVAPAKADEAHMDKYHADPQYDQWFRSLRGPASAAFPGGIDCCNLNDCERVEAEWRQRPDGQWAWFTALPQRGGKWFEVPADRIVKDKPSIDGEAYACVNKANLGGSPIRCFVPAIPGF